MSDQARPCPTENELLARVAGTPSPDRAALVDQHIDQCSSCRMLLAEAARGAPEVGLRPISLATFAPDESVASRYVVKHRLAAGGMGEVYEAHDAWLDELIAIKTIVPTIADNELALARLKAEMRLARRVTHKNVCRVYDLGFHRRGSEQIAFLTMELVRGTTLRKRFEEHGPFDTNALLPIVEQIVAALGHAHAEGIVHRDLKPDNVMLVENGDGTPDRVVVMDFGLARMALVADTQPLTPNSHTVLGTLDYMSPEQVQGKHAGPASDIYSLGVVVFELLTGSLPFEGESPLTRALLRVTRRPLTVGDALPGVESAWSACVGRCLEPDPRDRFETIDAILQALPRAPEAGRRSRQAWRRVLGLVAAVGVGAVAALAVLAREGKRLSAEAGETFEPVAASPAIPAPTPAAPLSEPSNAFVPTPEPTGAGPDPTPTLSKRQVSLKTSPTKGPPVPLRSGGDEASSVAPAAEAKPPGTSTATFQDVDRRAPASGNALMNPFGAGAVSHEKRPESKSTSP